MSQHHHLTAPSGYPQTPHSMYARFHSSQRPLKLKPVRHPHSRFSRRLDSTYSNPASQHSNYMTHGSHLRLTEVHPRELEHFIHGINRIHQNIGLPCPLHVSRSFRRSSGAPSRVHILPLSTANNHQQGESMSRAPLVSRA